MKSLGQLTKAYLPLSLVITLIGVQPAVFAGSALDPYAHIQAPDSTAKKKLTSVSAVDNVVTPSTYVTMPMGGDTTLLQPAKKPGMFSGLKIPVAGLPNPFKGGNKETAKSAPPKPQTSVASGAKPKGDGLMKKSASMMANGFKATGKGIAGGTAKMASASTSLIPGGGGGKKQAPKQELAGGGSSLNEMYVNKAKSNIAIAKENNKETGNAKTPTTKEMLGGQTGEQKVATKKHLMPSVPFMKKKHHKETSVAEANAGSGFLDGALDKKSGMTDLKSSQQLATTNSGKDAPVVASNAQAKTKKKGLLPGMPKLKAPQLASIPFMGKKKEEKAKPGQGFVAAAESNKAAQQHQIPVSPAAESKNTSVADRGIDPTDPYPDVKPTAVAQHPGTAPAKKGGLLKMPSVKMPRIGIPGLGKKAAPAPKREEVL